MPIIQPTPIDQLPQPPNPADRSNFNSLAYPFTAAMLPLTVQINKAVSDMYNNALEAEDKASEASVSAGEAHDSELAAQAAERLAKGHKNAAAISAGQAGDSVLVATAAAGQAALARDKAQQWATATGIVEGGLKGSKSYAQDAAQSATDAAQSAADAAGVVQGNFGPAIHAATAKSKPADADELAVADSQASWSLKKLTWSNLKAAIWAAFKAIATGGNAKDTLGLGTAATRDVGVNSGELVVAGTPTAIAALDKRALNPNDLGGNFSRKAAFFFTSRGGLVSGSANSEYGDFLALDTYSDASGGRINGLFFRKDGSGTIELFSASKGAANWVSVGSLYHTGNILHTTGQSTQYPMTQKAVTDAIASIDVSGPRPTKDHGEVATAGSQTVVCNVQESDFHIMSMETANTTGRLTIDFANIPNLTGKHFSWHVQIQRGGRKSQMPLFAQTVRWAGGAMPELARASAAVDVLMFYKVGDGDIRGMLVDAY